MQDVEGPYDSVTEGQTGQKQMKGPGRHFSEGPTRTMRTCARASPRDVRGELPGACTAQAQGGATGRGGQGGEDVGLGPLLLPVGT